MKKLKYAAVAVSVMSVIGTMSLTGCTSKAEVEALRQQVRDLENAVVAVDKNRRVTREATENFYLDVRRSAAIEKGGFKHTLYNTSNYSSETYPDNVKYDLNDRFTSESGLVAGNAKSGSSLKDPNTLFGDSDITRYFKANGTVSDYSYYHYGRWQRLCNAGKNMDGLDWIFVMKNRNKFPNELVGRCTLPEDSVMAKHGFKPLHGTTSSSTVVEEPLLDTDTSNTITQSEGNISLYPANLSESETVATPQPRLRETNLKEVQLQRAPKEYIPDEMQGKVTSKVPTQTQSMSMSNATVTNNPSTPVKPEIRDSLNSRSVEKVVTTTTVTKAPVKKNSSTATNKKPATTAKTSTSKKSEVVGLKELEEELRIDDAEL